MLFAINNLKEGFSGYYKAKGVFSKRNQGRGNYYNRRGGGIFTLIVIIALTRIFSKI
jgi:hypothetical protein